MGCEMHLLLAGFRPTHLSNLMSRGLLLSYTFLVCLAPLGCGGGNPHTPGDKTYAASVKPGTRAPSSSLEREILAQLGTDSPFPIEGNNVIAGPPYHAASGRLCRRISVDTGADSLACEMDDGWHFVPQIHLSGPSGK